MSTITTPKAEASSAAAAGSSDFMAVDEAIVDRAIALRGLIRENAEAAAAASRVVPEVIEALEQNQLLQLTVPKRYGGLDVNQQTFTRVLTELAIGDGSTGWSAMLVNIGNWMATTWPERAQDEIWGNDYDGKTCVVLPPSGTSVRTENGYRVSGKWPYASGSYTSTHAMMGFLIEQEDGSMRPALGIFQPGEWSIERSWFPIGLRGTGSDTVVVEDVEIPAYRVQYHDEIFGGNYATELQGSEIRANAAYLPTGTIIFASVLLGLGRAAYEIAVDRMHNKGVAGTAYTQTTESPMHQAAVARAMGLLDVSEMLVQRSSRDIDEWALKGEFMDPVTRGRVRHDTGLVVEFVTEAVDQLLKAAGSSSFMQANPLSRIHEDVSTGGSHVHATPLMAIDVYGKLLLDSSTPLPAAV